MPLAEMTARWRQPLRRRSTSSPRCGRRAGSPGADRRDQARARRRAGCWSPTSIRCAWPRIYRGERRGRDQRADRRDAIFGGSLDHLRAVAERKAGRRRPAPAAQGFHLRPVPGLPGARGRRGRDPADRRGAGRRRCSPSCCALAAGPRHGRAGRSAHAEAELETALACGARADRDQQPRTCTTFTVSLETTLRLGRAVPAEVCLVAESGIFTRRGRGAAGGGRTWRRRPRRGRDPGRRGAGHRAGCGARRCRELAGMHAPERRAARR